ncbi:MAG TPA: hypothetical protein VHU83_10880 [Bryobacteraceae bacterium]|nr:hypothetical protein [Bryobacteraceae bacterium]
MNSLVRCGAYPYLGGSFPIANFNIEALPAEKTGINGPCARAKHGYSSSENRQQDVNPLNVSL